MPYPLSPREMDVLKMLVDGLTDKEIGAKLGITRNTAKTHVTRIRRKVGKLGDTRTALAVAAVRVGLA